jgi:hypothetical protein
MSSLHHPTSDTTRKQSHDEKSRFSRIGSDADRNLRTGVCGNGHPGHVVCGSDQPLRSASGLRLQCFRFGNGGADGRAQCIPLSWRTEIERLTLMTRARVAKLGAAPAQSPKSACRKNRERSRATQWRIDRAGRPARLQISQKRKRSPTVGSIVLRLR